MNKTLKTQLTISEYKNKQSSVDYLLKVWEELFAYPDSNRTWVLPATIEGRKILKLQHFDAIISSSTPASVHLVAAHLAKEFKLPWIADFRDLWTQNHYYHFSKIRKKIEEQLEVNTLSAANVLITVSQPLKKKLEDLHKGQVTYSILNGYDPDQINPGIPLTKKFSITYTGGLYKGHRDPEPLFQALRNLIDNKIIDQELIEVNFFGYDEGWLINDVKKYYLESLVKIYGPISRESSIQKQRESQILLLLTWNDPSEKGVYTGKLFDYLAARRPILSIGYKEGDVVKELLDQTHAGEHVSNMNDLKEYIIKKYQEYSKLGRVQYPGIEEKILKYSHLEMAKNFAEVLNSITG